MAVVLQNIESNQKIFVFTYLCQQSLYFTKYNVEYGTTLRQHCICLSWIQVCNVKPIEQLVVASLSKFVAMFSTPYA